MSSRPQLPSFLRALSRLVGRRRVGSRRRARLLLTNVLVQVMCMLIALLVALPAWAAQGDLYRCRYSGRIFSARYCEQARPAAAAPEAPTAMPTSCCDLLHLSGGGASQAARIDFELASPLALASNLLLIPPPVPRHSSRTVARAVDHARDGPSIFLRDCRLQT